MFRALRRLLTVCTLAGLMLLGGCATTGTGDPRDPLEPMNRAIYTFNDGVDTVLLKPIAEVYTAILPDFVRTGISNFFANINDIIIALNNLLQGKVGNAFSDVGRIMINTTVGVLGVIDVASELGLEKHDEDFGQTLGYWGIGDGAYLVLPFLGPRTVRDTVGLVGDVYSDPMAYIDPVRDRNAAWGLRFVSRRAELLSASKVLETAALDPYDFMRDAYLQRRRNQVYDGNPPREKDSDAGTAPARGVNLRIVAEELPVSILVSGQPTPAEEEALLLGQKPAYPALPAAESSPQ